MAGGRHGSGPDSARDGRPGRGELGVPGRPDGGQAGRGLPVPRLYHVVAAHQVRMRPQSADQQEPRRQAPAVSPD